MPAEAPYRDTCTDAFGLFAELGKCTVQNLTVTASCAGTVAGGAAGILAGRATGTTVRSVRVAGEICSSGGARTGGIAGEITGTVTGCRSDASVSGDGYGCGGIAGYYSGTMTLTSSYGTVSGRSFCGGLIGLCEGNSNVKNCCSYCDVSASAVSLSVPAEGPGDTLLLTLWAPSGSLIGCLSASGTESSPTAFRLSYCFSGGTLDAACDARYRCSLVGYVADDLSRFIPVRGLKTKMYSGVSANYTLDRADEFARPLEFSASSAYAGAYVSVPARIVTGLSASAALSQSSFKGWDFKTVWKMGEKGPELRE